MISSLADPRSSERETKFNTRPPTAYTLFSLYNVPAWNKYSSLFKFILLRFFISIFFLYEFGYPFEHTTMHRLFLFFHSIFIFTSHLFVTWEKRLKKII